MSSVSFRNALLGGAFLAATAAVSATPAHATPTSLSFGFTGFGTTIVNTGDISASTTTKTLPSLELVNTISISDAAAAVLAGIKLGSLVAVTPLTIPTVLGNPTIVISVGALTYTFTHEIYAALVATTGAINGAGNISLQFSGSITGDTSLGQGFLNQTASLSESCTQTGLGAVINCSDSLDTPSRIAEPATMAILGAGFLGLAAVRRRKS